MQYLDCAVIKFNAHHHQLAKASWTIRGAKLLTRKTTRWRTLSTKAIRMRNLSSKDTRTTRYFGWRPQQKKTQKNCSRWNPHLNWQTKRSSTSSRTLPGMSWISNYRKHRRYASAGYQRKKHLRNFTFRCVRFFRAPIPWSVVRKKFSSFFLRRFRALLPKLVLSPKETGYRRRRFMNEGARCASWPTSFGPVPTQILRKDLSCLNYILRSSWKKS